jgi:hypothetical protein
VVKLAPRDSDATPNADGWQFASGQHLEDLRAAETEEDGNLLGAKQDRRLIRQIGHRRLAPLSGLWTTLVNASWIMSPTFSRAYASLVGDVSLS